jgi:fluoride exporter
MTWLMVAAGAGAGAACRYLLDTAVTRRFGDRLPWGTLLVNLLGSALLGLLAGRSLSHPVSPPVVALLGVGFCGAFTTASTVAWETVALAEDGWPLRAVANLVVSVVLGLALAGGGLAMGMSW